MKNNIRIKNKQMKNLKIAIAFLACLSVCVNTTSAQTIEKDSIQRYYFGLLQQYNGGKRNTSFIDSLYRETWNYAKDYKQAKNLANEYVRSFDVGKSLAKENLDLIKLMNDTAKDPDHGFEFSALRQKYQQLLSAYDLGKRNSPLEMNLAFFAKILKEKEVARNVSKSYIQSLSKKSIFIKDNLGFIKEFTQSSTDRGFDIFFNNRTKVNALLGNNAAEAMLRKVISKEEVEPYVDVANANPNWEEILQKVRNKYGDLGTEKVYGAQMLWYLEKEDWRNFGKYYALYYKTAITRSEYHINNISWAVFEHVNDPKVLKVAIEAQKYSIDNFAKDNPNDLDTYANLLYKFGQKNEAILYQEKAVKLEPTNDDFKLNLKKMKMDQITWPQPMSIDFEKSLSLTGVMKEARVKNKLIMLDFMATWCGPCKEMEKYVYSDPEVGKVINASFIAAKIQTDKTPSDSEYVKSWHSDAERLVKEYEITGFPTLVFLNPEGKIIKK
ncbi:thioredoxin fold domain-containing protein [Pedobacter steynii]